MHLGFLKLEISELQGVDGRVNELECEVKELKKSIEARDSTLDTLTELLNTDGALDRINQSFEQISSMILSKSFISKIDEKALSWLRNLYGEKVIKHINDNLQKSPMRKRKTRKSSRATRTSETKNIMNEVFEILTQMLEWPSIHLNPSILQNLELMRDKFTSAQNTTIKTHFPQHEIGILGSLNQESRSCGRTRNFKNASFLNTSLYTP